jgi:hypothetical protein
MAIADLVYEQTKKLPEHLAREVLPRAVTRGSSAI